MSGILRKTYRYMKSNKKKTFLAVVGLLLLILFVIVELYTAAVLAILYEIVLLVNECTVMKSQKQAEPFSPRSTVRNLDYLIIGDLCEPKQLIDGGGY